MAITSTTATRLGNMTTVTVVSDLSGVIFYHWYIDGALLASTQSPQHTFSLEVGEQARIEVKDTNDPDFDPVLNAPALFPGRWSVWWVRSTSSDVAKYRVEERLDTGSGFSAFVPIATVAHEPDRWTYSVLTGRLVDLATYEWRVVPVDTAGNDGTVITPDQEEILRIPDAPKFTIFFDIGRQRVRFDPV